MKTTDISKDRSLADLHFENSAHVWELLVNILMKNGLLVLKRFCRDGTIRIS